MGNGETIEGKGWHAFYRETDEQWVLKYRKEAGAWHQHRIPRKYQRPDEVRRYVSAWLDENNRLAKKRKARPDVFPAAGLAPDITFKQFGEMWTEGRLALLFPDHVRPKKTAEDDAERFNAYVYDHIGATPVADFAAPKGLYLAEQVMSGLPGHLGKASRRHVAQAMHRLLAIAVYPARLLPAQPLPKGFLPKLNRRREGAFLYPDEDAQLLATKKVPLGFRVLWAFEAREGPRPSEALRLSWSDFDLDRKFVHLDENKTDDPRSWTLNPGVAAALKAWKTRYFPKAKGAQLVFVQPCGHPLPRTDRLAERFRDHLRMAGITRKQLFQDDENRMQVRAYDLRATFVTVSLANGKSETWVSDRTGHRSSDMIRRYKRMARSTKEANLGELKPMMDAIPELSEDPDDHT